MEELGEVGKDLAHNPIGVGHVDQRADVCVMERWLQTRASAHNIPNMGKPPNNDS
jgi:hypothetical protein